MNYNPSPSPPPPQLPVGSFSARCARLLFVNAGDVVSVLHFPSANADARFRAAVSLLCRVLIKRARLIAQGRAHWRVWPLRLALRKVGREIKFDLARFCISCRKSRDAETFDVPGQHREHLSHAYFVLKNES
jgi:hypothetical protein